MKFIRYILLVLNIGLLLHGACGCTRSSEKTTFSYTFLQERHCVQRVEICLYQDGYPLGTITPLVQLAEPEVDLFWADIENLECRKTKKLDTPSGYGDIIFLVTYQNGEKEIFSLVWIGYISADGKHTETLQYFDPKKLSEVFAKYADPKVLVEKSEVFRHYWNSSEE